MAEKKKKIRSLIPPWQKRLLTLEEASDYSNIGPTTLRKLVKDPRCTFTIHNGNRILIKKQEFDEFISNAIEL